jgi:hypothetical protein
MSEEKYSKIEVIVKGRKITPRESAFFHRIYSKIDKRFPYECSCGRKYKNEIEYNKDTREKEIRPLDTGWKFTRECECGKESELEIDINEFPKGLKNSFTKYLWERAGEENKLEIREVLEKFRKEYNSFLKAIKRSEKRHKGLLN